MADIKLADSSGIPPNVNVTKPPQLVAEKAFVLPIYIYTAIFGVIFIVGPLLARRGPNAGITRCCIMISAFCCWIFWTTTYLVQMNPLLGPRMTNTTLAWIGHKWGKDATTNPSSNETEITSVSPPVLRQVLDAVPALDAMDPLAEPNVMNQQDEQKEPEPLADDNKPKDPPEEDRIQEPLASDPPADSPQAEDPARRRFNSTNLFANLTHLIRD